MRKSYTGNEGVRDASQELIYGINIRNTLRQQRLSVGTSPTLLPATALDKRFSMMIHNDSTNIVYIGGSDVATSGAKKGMPVYPRGKLPLSIEDEVEVYGIAGSASNVILLEGA